jgi:4-amino-4-deoxy-L-arabinose transferase-like glycosyltransferase
MEAREMRNDAGGRNAGMTLVLILALAFTLRLVFVIFPADGVPFSDMKDYHDQAFALLAKGTYGPALRPPLYPLFLAAVYRIAGREFIFVRLIQALMGVGVCLFTYAIGRRLYGPRAGIAAGLIAACYPSLILYTCLLMSENLFIFLLTASLLLLLGTSQRRVGSCFAAGVLIGLACLTRSVLVGFVPLSALWLIGRRERIAALVCMLGALCAITPWTVRNWHYYQRFVLIDSYGGYNFLIGNNPDATGRQDREIVTKLRETVWKRCRGDAHRAAVGYREGLRFIIAHPGRFLNLGITKMGYLYGPEIRELSWGYSRNFFGEVPRPLLIPAAAAVIAAFPLVAVFAIFGVCLRGVGPGGWRGAGGLLILAVFYFSVAHFLTFGESRFHLPLVPIFAVFAGSLARRDEKPVMESPHEGRVAARIIVSAVLLTLLSLNWAVRLGEDWVRLGRVLGPGGNTASLNY